jgi:DNA modification methylase
MAAKLGKGDYMAARKPHVAPQGAITHIRDLTADPQNRRKRTPRNVGMIVDALQKVGAARSIVIDEAGEVLAGNGVLEAAGEAGITKVQVVDADGETIIAVRRRNLTPEQKRKLAIYDNRTAELAEWDTAQLAADLEAGEDLSAFFFEDELKALLANDATKVDGLTDPDAVPEQRPADIKTGDLFQLGKHRLLCGDSTKADTFDVLLSGELAHCIFTDPPYGVGYTGGMKKREALANDHIGTNIYSEALPLLAGAADDSAALYLWYADGHAAAAAAAAAAAGYQIVAQIIWAKNHAQFVTSAHYKGKHEPCYYAHKKGKSARWHGPNNEVTLWEYSRAAANDFHPTQKPVEIAVRAINNSTEPGQIVLDGFCGGGTTIIAAEQSGRRGFGVELDPSYCQVIIDRWEAFIGQKAAKL